MTRLSEDRAAALPLASPLVEFDELISEPVACERYEALLSPRELRRARQKGEIEFVAGKKGTIFYTHAALAAYLKRKVRPCRDETRSSGRTENTGSAVLPAPRLSTSTGVTEEAARLLEDRFERKFLKKRKDD